MAKLLEVRIGQAGDLDRPTSSWRQHCDHWPPGAALLNKTRDRLVTYCGVCCLFFRELHGILIFLISKLKPCHALLARACRRCLKARLEYELVRMDSDKPAVASFATDIEAQRWLIQPHTNPDVCFFMRLEA